MGNASKYLPITRPPCSLFPFLYRSTSSSSKLLRVSITTSNKRIQEPSLQPLQPRHSIFRRQSTSACRDEQCSRGRISSRYFHTSSLKSRDFRDDTAVEQKWSSKRRDDNSISESIPFELPSDSLTDSGRESTITHVERAAFGRLFGTLLAPQPRDSKGTARNHKNVENTRQTEQEESLVLAAEAEIRGQPGEDEQDIIPSDQIAPEDAARLRRYPKPLRDMAVKTQLRLARKTNQPEDQVILEARKEMSRVETKLLAAETDLALWEVLEDEVFSKMKMLDLDTKHATSAQQPEPPSKDADQKQQPKENPDANPTMSAQQPDPPSKAADKKQQQQQQQQQRKKGAQNSITADQPAQTTLAIIIHAYAPLLLTALRILTQRAPTSTLPAALLARAKALGRTSYALAASTPLYNDLLAWTWRSTASYAQLLALLREMDAAGLTMDVRTLDAVDEVCVYRERAAGAGAALGHGVAALEGACRGRAREGEEVLAWREKIRAGLEEMEMERLTRAEALRQLEREEQQEQEREGGDDGGGRRWSAAGS